MYVYFSVYVCIRMYMYIFQLLRFANILKPRLSGSPPLSYTHLDSLVPLPSHTHTYTHPFSSALSYFLSLSPCLPLCARSSRNVSLYVRECVCSLCLSDSLLCLCLSRLCPFRCFLSLPPYVSLLLFVCLSGYF